MDVPTCVVTYRPFCAFHFLPWPSIPLLHIALPGSRPYVWDRTRTVLWLLGYQRCRCVVVHIDVALMKESAVRDAHACAVLTLIIRAGKTTTLRILSGDAIPTSGKATLAGFDIMTQQPEVRVVVAVFCLCMPPDDPALSYDRCGDCSVIVPSLMPCLVRASVIVFTWLVMSSLCVCAVLRVVDLACFVWYVADLLTVREHLELCVTHSRASTRRRTIVVHEASQ